MEQTAQSLRHVCCRFSYIVKTKACHCIEILHAFQEESTEKIANASQQETRYHLDSGPENQVCSCDKHGGNGNRSCMVMPLAVT